MHRVQGCCKESIVLGFVARGTKRCKLSPLETEAVVGTFCKVCKHIHEVSGRLVLFSLSNFITFISNFCLHPDPLSLHLEKRTYTEQGKILYGDVRNFL